MCVCVRVCVCACVLWLFSSLSIVTYLFPSGCFIGFLSIQSETSVKEVTDVTNVAATTFQDISASGSNDGSATGLGVCVGECDYDSQCSGSFQCFQREHAEKIPGCNGNGAGNNWDYCYDPNMFASISWSDGTTNSYNSHSVRGPWGNNLQTVTATFSKATSGYCKYSWRQWYSDSRDSEEDRVYINDNLVYSSRQQWSGSGCGTSGYTDGDGGHWPNTWGGYPNSPACYRDVEVEAACNSGSNVIRFESDIDQALNDEGWAIGNLWVEMADASEVTDDQISWSNTDMGTWNGHTLHGIFGNAAGETSISGTFSMSVGTACTVSWRQWYTDSRDSETDQVYLNNDQLLSYQAQWSSSGCGTSGYTDGDQGGFPNTWHSYPHSPACYKDYSVSSTCNAGTNTITFTSGIDQAENDEGWGFGPVTISYPQEDCADGTYRNGAVCSAWSNCGAGQYVSTQPTITNNRGCTSCPSGQYQTGTNANSCTAWSNCGAGQYVSGNPSSSANRVCQSCGSGQFSTSTNQGSCTTWSTCNAGTIITTDGTSTNDRGCTGCSQGSNPTDPDNVGTFTTSANLYTCTAWTTVPTDTNSVHQNPEGSYITTHGTATSDRSFSTWTTCQLGEYVTTQPTKVSNRACSPVAMGFYTTQLNQNTPVQWTVCNPGQFVTVDPTTSTDRQCQNVGDYQYTTEISMQGQLESPTAGAHAPSDWTKLAYDIGMTVPGTVSTDVVYRDCIYGEVSFVDVNQIPLTYYDQCKALIDSDGDGLFDRYPVMDTRSTPCCGASYDVCPFDAKNDEDGDSICGGVEPQHTAGGVLGQQPPMRTNPSTDLTYLDVCQTDPTNDDDKDGLCDDEAKETKTRDVKNGLLHTWDFKSNSIIGWNDIDGVAQVLDADVATLTTQDWSGDDLCDGCYMKTKKKKTGSMESARFDLSFKSIEFTTGGAGKVELFVKDQGEFSSVRQENVDYDGTYQVVWNINEFYGKVAYIKVSDDSEHDGVIVDDVLFYDGASGCLSECVVIENDMCGDRGFEELCFKFGDDQTPYVVNQKLSETTAEYCREDTPGTSGGTSLDFLTSVGSKLTHINEEMAYLPRCLTIEIGSGSDLAGSYVISLRGGRRFAFSKVEGNHYCVYNTEKPWCADEYAPLNYFRKDRNQKFCETVELEVGCLDLCYANHCQGYPTCGHQKAFDDCARCCDNNHNSASGCFRRRRLLEMALENEDKTIQQCAQDCMTKNVEAGQLNEGDAECVAFTNDDGKCKMATMCYAKAADKAKVKGALYYSHPGKDAFADAPMPRTDFGKEGNGLARKRVRRRKKN